jgi:thioredoxin reductase (NADPH)
MITKDLIIVGAGPAGLTAAIYAATSGTDLLVISGFTGSAAATAPAVANYPGFPAPIAGSELVANFENQAKNLGTRIESDSIEEITKNEDGTFTLKGTLNTYSAKAVIYAAGAQARRLRLGEEPKYFGKGVSVCATCDGHFFKGKDVAVAAGDKTALSEAIYLANICRSVYYVTKDQEVPKELKALSNIVPKTNAAISALQGEKRLEAIELTDETTKEKETIEVQGLFTAVGHDPETAPLKNLPVLDEKGAVITNPDASTPVSGLFAAGDVTKGAIRQIVFAANQGMQAALSARKYLRNLH